jgi:hypothetical protein
MGVADPILKEDVWILMRTWGRVVEDGEGVRVLWSLVDENESSSGGWEGGSAEDLKRVRRFVPLLLLHPHVNLSPSSIQGQPRRETRSSYARRPTAYFCY